MDLNAQKVICSAGLFQAYCSMSDALSFPVCAVLERNKYAMVKNLSDYPRYNFSKAGSVS